MTDHRLRALTLRERPSEAGAARGRRPPMSGPQPPADRWSAGRVLAMLSVLPTLLCTAWLVSAFPLAAVGQFRVFLVVPLAVAAAAVILPLGTGPLRRQASQSQAAPSHAPQSQLRGPWWATVASALVAVGFAVFVAATHSQQAILRRDAGSYAQIGLWLSQQHSLTAPIPSAAFGAAWPDLTFASPAFYVQGDTIVAQFMSGWPTMLAAANWIAGWPGMFVLPALIGGCLILAVAGLTARLVGARWAPLAALLVALAWPVLRVSQTTYSEPLAGLVLAGGMCLLLDTLAAARRDGGSPRRVTGAGFVAGLVLTSGELVRLDMGVDFALLVPVIGWWWYTRRPGAGAFVAGAAVGGALAVIDGAFVTLPYVRTNWSSVRLMLVGLTIVVVGTVIAVAAARSGWRSPLASHRRRSAPTSHGWPWLAPAGAATVLVLAAALVLRPYLHVDHSNTSLSVIAYTAEMQGWLGLPIDGTRGYTEHSLWWASWYLGWPLLAAALVGAMVLTFRVLRSRDRRWTLILLVYGVSALLTFIRPGITPDHPWADRRMVVEVIPGMVLLATWTAAAGTRAIRPFAAALTTWVRAPLGWAGPAVVATGLAAGFAVPMFLVAAPIAVQRTELGEVAAANTVCQALRPDDSVVLLDSLWVPTIRGQCGLPVALLTDSSPARVARLTASIRAAGRTPVFGAAHSASLSGLQLSPNRVVELHTRQDQHQLLQRPDSTDPLVIEFWLVRP